MNIKVGYIYKVVPPENDIFYIKIFKEIFGRYEYIILQGNDISGRKGFDRGSRFEQFIEEEFSEDEYLVEIL